MKKSVMSLLLSVLFAFSATMGLGETVIMWNEVNGEEYGATVGAHAFEKKLLELSDGKMMLDLYINAELGSEAESMQGIQMGTLDIFRGNASSLSSYGADLIAATGLPFLFESMEEFQEFAQSDLGQAVLDSVEAADCGFVALGWMVEGPRSIFITEQTWKTLGEPEQVTLDSMKGLVIRSGNALIEQTLQALGAETVPVVFSELKKSLQAGNIDGAENGITPYLDNEFYQPAPFFIPDAHIFGCGVILMSKATWEALSEEEKGWVREAAQAAGDACYEYNVEYEQACMDQFDALGIHTLPVADLEKWQEACQPLYDQQGETVQELIRQVQHREY